MSRLTHGFGDWPWWLIILLTVVTSPIVAAEWLWEHRTGVWQVTSLLLLTAILALLVLK